MKCKKISKLIEVVIIMSVGIVMLSGCGQKNNSSEQSMNIEPFETNIISESEIQDSDIKQIATESEDNQGITENQDLIVTFGDFGSSFALHLYDNNTAAAIAGYVGSSDWRLPIYHYDDYEGYEYYQYYDIPSRYEIPSNPETATSAKAGEVYYSEPNRMILFYQDAEVSQELTPVGYIDNTEEFVQAVEENPVLEGWGNKIVLISDGE